MKTEDLEKICANHIGIPGRMISGSKSYYRDKFPDHKIYFNANIICKSFGKIWFGDIDLDIDSDKLVRIADEIEENIYVLREMDARFGSEDRSFEELKKLAVWGSEEKYLQY